MTLIVIMWHDRSSTVWHWNVLRRCRTYDQVAARGEAETKEEASEAAEAARQRLQGKGIGLFGTTA